MSIKRVSIDLALFLILLIFSYLGVISQKVTLYVFENTKWLANFIPSLFVGLLFFFLTYYLVIKENPKTKYFKDYLVRFRIKKVNTIEIIVICGAVLIFTILNVIANRLFGSTETPVSAFLLGQLPLNSIVKKNLLTPIICTIMLLLFTLVEEIFWRGYLLPLQEKKYGKFAWIINGVLFAMSHILTFNPLIIIVSALGIPFLAYTYKNTTITLAIHLIMNLIAQIVLLVNWYFNLN